MYIERDCNFPIQVHPIKSNLDKKEKNRSNNNPPPPPSPPRNQPRSHSDPNAQRAPHRPKPITPPPDTVSVNTAPDGIRRVLVPTGVDDAPHGGARGGHHGDDAPVGAEVLDAPNDGDDDGDEGEGATVAQPHEGGGEVEELRVVDG